jgi:hypothetical protein
MTFSAPVLRKALKFQAEGRGREIQAERVFVVQGDTGTYAVIVHQDGGLTCTCRHRTPDCSHIAYAGLLMRDEAHD